MSDEVRTKFYDDMTRLVREYNLYTFDPNIKEMERDLMRSFDQALTAYKKELASRHYDDMHKTYDYDGIAQEVLQEDEVES